jgi:hypothetical protein
MGSRDRRAAPRAHAALIPFLSRVRRAVSAKGLAPQVRITSPLNGTFVAPGESRIGSASQRDAFAIDAEIVTRDDSP